VAVYSTFFVAAPEAILSGFPGWKLPLDKPVKREITDFFGERTIETRNPCGRMWRQARSRNQSTA
jgi:hypothetical protein